MNKNAAIKAGTIVITTMLTVCSAIECYFDLDGTVEVRDASVPMLRSCAGKRKSPNVPDALRQSLDTSPTKPSWAHRSQTKSNGSASSAQSM